MWKVKWGGNRKTIPIWIKLLLSQLINVSILVDKLIFLLHAVSCYQKDIVVGGQVERTLHKLSSLIISFPDSV